MHLPRQNQLRVQGGGTKECYQVPSTQSDILPHRHMPLGPRHRLWLGTCVEWLVIKGIGLGSKALV